MIELRGLVPDDEESLFLWRAEPDVARAVVARALETLEKVEG